MVRISGKVMLETGKNAALPNSHIEKLEDRYEIVKQKLRSSNELEWEQAKDIEHYRKKDTPFEIVVK